MSSVRYGGTSGSIYIEKESPKKKDISALKKEMENIPSLAPEIEEDLAELVKLSEEMGAYEQPMEKPKKKRKKEDE